MICNTCGHKIGYNPEVKLKTFREIMGEYNKLNRHLKHKYMAGDKDSYWYKKHEVREQIDRLLNKEYVEVKVND
jgi:hypothetical protein